jgi:hypothetical protein
MCETWHVCLCRLSSEHRLGLTLIGHCCQSGISLNVPSISELTGRGSVQLDTLSFGVDLSRVLRTSAGDHRTLQVSVTEIWGFTKLDIFSLVSTHSKWVRGWLYHGNDAGWV